MQLILLNIWSLWKVSDYVLVSLQAGQLCCICEIFHVIGLCLPSCLVNKYWFGHAPVKPKLPVSAPEKHNQEKKAQKSLPPLNFATKCGGHV